MYEIGKTNVGFNSIGTEGAKALADALKNNKILRSLNISKNKLAKVIGRNGIDEEGWKAISETLRINDTLLELDIRNVRS